MGATYRGSGKIGEQRLAGILTDTGIKHRVRNSMRGKF